MAERKTNGDHPKMSKVEETRVSFHQQNPEAPQHISAIDFPKLPSAPLPTSHIPQTQSPQIGLPADAHQDTVPVRGVNVRVHST